MDMFSKLQEVLSKNGLLAVQHDNWVGVYDNNKLVSVHNCADAAYHLHTGYMYMGV